MPHPTVASSVQKIIEDLPNFWARGTSKSGPAATPAIAAETYTIALLVMSTRGVV